MRAPAHACSPSLLGISFDGLAISGIVNEFLHLGAVARKRGLRVLCDLGYDLTLGRTPDLGSRYLPEWVAPVRALGETLPTEYTSRLAEMAFENVVDGTPICDIPAYALVVRELAERFVATFDRENVAVLVVENGTLPDNPLATEALHQAIQEYGQENELNAYVLWRDHDLMWSAEPRLYGAYPYAGVRKPRPNRYIQYAATSEWMRKRLQAWAPGVPYAVIPCRFAAGDPHPKVASFRTAYGIPDDAYLIARCTRVIPQKSIARDLYLLASLVERLRADKNERPLRLCVTGPVAECPEEYARLRELSSHLNVSGMIVWANGLHPAYHFHRRPETMPFEYSITDLLSEADLSSFLTTFDYEGFGMPPGEAMAAGIPFIATTYELYHEIYGRKGAIAPLLPIHSKSSPEEAIPADFVEWTYRALTDSEYRAQVIAHNSIIVERHFSLHALEQQLKELLPILLDQRSDHG